MAATGGPPDICQLVLCQTSGGNCPRIFLVRKIKDNIVNKALNFFYILKECFFIPWSVEVCCVFV